MLGTSYSSLGSFNILTVPTAKYCCFSFFLTKCTYCKPHSFLAALGPAQQPGRWWFTGRSWGSEGVLPPRVALRVVHLHGLQVGHAVGPPRRQQGSVEDHQRHLGTAPVSSPFVPTYFIYFYLFKFIPGIVDYRGHHALLIEVLIEDSIKKYNRFYNYVAIYKNVWSRGHEVMRS